MPSAATAFFESKSPSSSPMAIKGERSSPYLPANGFSITAMAAARRVGGATVCPISIYVSSTTVTILRMTALIVVRPRALISVISSMHRAFHCALDRPFRSGYLERSRRHRDHLAMQPQCGAVDQSRSEQFSRAIGPSFERILNFTTGQLANAAADQARAEIAVGLQIMRRAAEDGGMSGQIDGIGNDGGGSVGLRRGPRQAGDGIGEGA